MPNTKKIVAILTDLMFTAKILDAAKRAGLQVIFAKNADEAIEKSADKPAVIIVDLNATNIEPLEAIEKLKTSSVTGDVNLLGYLSHVQGELKLAAQQKGCDVVMARSAFSQNLPTLLKRYATLPHTGTRG